MPLFVETPLPLMSMPRAPFVYIELPYIALVVPELRSTPWFVLYAIVLPWPALVPPIVLPLLDVTETPTVFASPEDPAALVPM